MQRIATWAAGAALLCAATGSFAAHHEEKDLKAVAKGWYDAACADLAGFIAYVDKHMADDGVFMPGRYVGLGFTVDNNEGDDFGTVMSVTPGTPAAEVLKAGDQFVSVNGMAMTFANRDKTTFRGKPGEAVKAEIMRDGKKMPVEVNRGIIAAKNSKERVLANLALADADDWPADSCAVTDVIAEGKVVYVTGEWSDTEVETGYTFTQRGISRFEFNDDGKIVEGWNMTEERFVLEQLGYTISR